MASSTWKNAEKGVAKVLGGERVSNKRLGLRSIDVETDAYSVEVKNRKSLPAWLHNAVTQAHRNCASGKLPLVVLHQTGQRRVNDLVVLRLGEFREWFGEPERLPSDDPPEDGWETVAKSDRVQGGAK